MNTVARIPFLFVCLVLSGYMNAGAQQSKAQHAKEEISMVWHGKLQGSGDAGEIGTRPRSFRLIAMSLFSGDELLWTVRLPERMGSRDAFLSDPVSRMSWNGVDSLQSFRGAADVLSCPVLLTDEVVAVSDESGILVIASKTGEILLDIPYQKSAEQFYVDEGNLKITAYGDEHTESLTHGAEFIVMFHGNIIHFNGSELFLIRNGKVLRKVVYRSVTHLEKSGLVRSARLRVKRYTVEIQGRIFVR